MDELEVFSISSSDSNSTIINETWSMKLPSCTSEKSVNSKNLYNLNEFEDEDSCEIQKDNKRPYEGTNSDDVLKILSQKYLQRENSQPSTSKENLSEIILSFDSSSEDGYGMNSTEGEIGFNKNKNCVRIDLDDDNTILGNHDFSKMITNQNDQFLQENQMQASTKSFELTSISNKDNLSNTKSTKNKRSLELVCNSSDEEKRTKIDTNTNLTKPKKGGQKQRDIEKKLTAEEKKAAKERERAEKTEQLRKEKALKDAQKKMYKCHKPEECLKYIIVDMDPSVFNNTVYGDSLKAHFISKDITCRMKTSLPGMISWCRKTVTLNKMAIAETESKEKHYAVIIKPEAFGNLSTCIQSIKEQTDFSHLSLFIYGQSKPTPSQEDEIIDVEMIYPTYWQFVKSKEELGDFLFMLTKSIAQIPYKLKQEEKYKEQSEYFEDCNKKLVKVDKDGNGLGRLWSQMLTMFPLVRLEAADALTAIYPTPNSLFEAYENCTEDGELLVKNLPIRRAQGPLVSNRRLGPEFSKKCYRFFTSEENILL